MSADVLLHMALHRVTARVYRDQLGTKAFSPRRLLLLGPGVPAVQSLRIEGENREPRELFINPPHSAELFAPHAERAPTDVVVQGEHMAQGDLLVLEFVADVPEGFSGVVVLGTGSEER